jgi:hypothetical protein
MIVACPTCKAVVDAKEHGQFKRLLEDESGNRGGAAYVVGECSKCGGAPFAKQEISVDGDEEYYSEPKRLWPSPPSDALASMPRPISHALDEADKCLFGQAYSASVVMSVQAIEGICRHFGTKSDKLFNGLKELRDGEIIDKKLYEWADELRKHRNLAAHPTGIKFTRIDAEDIFDFARAICEYVFVLTVRFERFKERAIAKQRPKAKS